MSAAAALPSSRNNEAVGPSARRLLWAGVSASLAALAVTAIVAVVAGSFGGDFWRTIGTVVILFTCGATALAGNELVHRRQLHPLGWIVLAIAPSCAVTLLVGDWTRDVSNTFAKGILTAVLVVLAALIVATLRLVVDLTTPATLVLFSGVVLCAVLMVGLGVPLIWIAHVPDAALKTLLVLIVLVLIGYAATPVVQRLTHRH
jgi:hypothetical protein